MLCYISPVYYVLFNYISLSNLITTYLFLLINHELNLNNIKLEYLFDWEKIFLDIGKRRGVDSTFMYPTYSIMVMTSVGQNLKCRDAI